MGLQCSKSCARQQEPASTAKATGLPPGPSSPGEGRRQGHAAPPQKDQPPLARNQAGAGGASPERGQGLGGRPWNGSGPLKLGPHPTAAMDCPAATVFCDFDGTVTSIDTFDAVAALAAPQLWAELKAQLFTFEINLRQGMQALADGLNPGDLERMVAHMGQYAPRPCFLPFLSELERAGLPFVLVSGGLIPLVEEVLGPHRHRLDQLIAAEVLPHPQGGQIGRAHV